MRVGVTGTPGTGKTTAVDLVDTDLSVIHLNEVIREEGLYDEVDEERDSVVADLDAVRKWLGDRDDLLVDSHLAHHFTMDRVIVLRCHPDELKRRLRAREEAKPVDERKSDDALERYADENAQSEALDVILSETVAEHGEENVYEIDATDADPDVVAAAIEAVLAGNREPSAGEVSYVDYL